LTEDQEIEMRIGKIASLAAMALFQQLAYAMPVPSYAQSAPPPIIEDMRKRDRFNKPSVEVAAWRAFLDRALADPASPPALIVEARINLSLVLLNDSQGDEATKQVDTAAALFEKAHLENTKLAPEVYEALSYQNTYEPALALGYAEKGLALARKYYGEESEMVARAYYALGNVYAAKGDEAEARHFACLSAERAQAYVTHSNWLYSGSLMSCGAHGFNVDDETSIDILRRAATLAFQNLPRDHMYVRAALNVSGSTLLNMGRYAEAADVFRQSIDASIENLGPNSVLVYHAQRRLAQALELQGKFEESEAVRRAGAEFVHRINGSASGGDKEDNGNSYVFLSILLEKRGKYEDALTYARRGLAELKALLPEENTEVAYAEICLARLLAHDGNYAEALSIAQPALANLEKSLGAKHRKALSAKLDVARILDALGRKAEAFESASTASYALEEKLFDLAARHKDIVSISQVMTHSFGDFALIALHNSRTSEAVYAAQLASISELSLVNAELGANMQAQKKGLGDLIKSARGTRNRATALQISFDAIEGGGKGDLLKTGADLKAARAELLAINAQVNEHFPAYAQVSRPRPASLAEIQARLTADQALILPLNLNDRVVTMAVTNKDVFWSEGKGSNVETSALVLRIRKSIDDARFSQNSKDANFDGDAAYALYQALFPGDLGSKLAPKPEWLFPSSGLAASIPPAVLLAKAPSKSAKLADYSWLIKHHAVAIISDFSLPAEQLRPQDKMEFAGVGDPSLAGVGLEKIDYAALFRGGKTTPQSVSALPNLPGTRAELIGMGAALGHGHPFLLTGSGATESAVKSLDFRPYSVVAFATHGLTSGELSGLAEPALVLTPPAISTVTDDGLLTAAEITQLTIPADWVILSACNSGSGRNSTSPSYSGLARAFRAAGARSLLVSHWLVRDDVAGKITINTIKGAARGASRPQALRKAILKVMTDRRIPGGGNPATWAPFVLIEN
jgi:CHAT domain-containing protein